MMVVIRNTLSQSFKQMCIHWCQPRRGDQTTVGVVVMCWLGRSGCSCVCHQFDVGHSDAKWMQLSLTRVNKSTRYTPL